MRARADVSKVEAGVLSEIEALVRELKGGRAVHAIRPEASLEKDLGLGSLERVELLSRLERRFRTRVADETLADAETPHHLALALVEGAGPAALPTDVSAERFVAKTLAPPSDARTLSEVLRRRAASSPAEPHIYLKADGRLEETITFGALYAEARTVAAALVSRGIEPGDKIAIMLPTSRDFFATFMGALLAGAVPVPLYPPFSSKHLAEYARRQTAIVKNARARLFVTPPKGRAIGDFLAGDAPELREVVTSADLTGTPDGFEPVETVSDTIALIQYTSGSTGEPKGVPLSHGNLLANIRVIGEVLEIASSDVGVSWLPLYHDMGLIGAWLTPLYFGIPVAILSPLAFLARPERWFWTIHQRRGTISPAPNFAYELAVRKIRDEDLEGLDLSSWRVALNGAEPVLPRTLESFTTRFSPYGFRAESMLPVYGLAESSLLLSAPPLGRVPRIETVDRSSYETDGRIRRPEPGSSTLRFVSVGKIVPDHEARIVDERGNLVPEFREGRLLFRGPSVMRGYFENERASAAARRGEGFLDSGDRAFMADGELFITGRDKDVIIRAGRNLIPQEIESVVAETEGVRRGCVAAFGVSEESSGTEKLVVVAESRDETKEGRIRIAQAIQDRLMEATGIPPDDIVLVGPRTVPKTSSGKIRRSACRELYTRGSLGGRGHVSSLLLWARVALRSSLAIARRGARRAGHYLYGSYAFPLTMAFLLCGWLVSCAGLSRRSLRSFVHRAAGLYLRASGMRWRLSGAERLIRFEPPYVIVANHASYLDAVLVMAVLEIDYAFVVKREAETWPVVGRFIRQLEHVAVERERADESARSTEALKRLLSAGRSVVVFPEGTFSYANGLRPFKLGAFQLAGETGRPLVPVALVGTRRWLRDGTWIPRPGRLEVVIGEPRFVKGSFPDIVRTREAVADGLAALVGEPRIDLVRAGPTLN